MEQLSRAYAYPGRAKDVAGVRKQLAAYEDSPLEDVNTTILHASRYVIPDLKLYSLCRSLGQKSELDYLYS